MISPTQMGAVRPDGVSGMMLTMASAGPETRYERAEMLDIRSRASLPAAAETARSEAETSEAERGRSHHARPADDSPAKPPATQASKLTKNWVEGRNIPFVDSESEPGDSQRTLKQPSSGEGARSSGAPRRVGWVSVAGGIVFMGLMGVAVYVFILTQLLPPQDVWLAPSIPFSGFYGEDQVLPGLSYIQLLEFSGAGSAVGLFFYAYGREGSSRGWRRVLLSLATPLKAFGISLAAIVYTETHLLWGELWYGVKLVDVYPQGFPWGNERVASNTCFLHGADYIPSYGAYCWFFNYDELLLVSVVAAVAGFLLSHYLRRPSHQPGAP
jgi:hypothetical protein